MGNFPFLIISALLLSLYSQAQKDGARQEQKDEVTSLRYLTPEMFGAKGDGLADDTRAIFLALSDTGELPVRLDKIYRIHQILIQGKQKLHIGGIGTLLLADHADTDMLVFKSCPDLNLSDITLKGNTGQQNRTSRGIFMDGCNNFSLNGIVVDSVRGGVHDYDAAISINNSIGGAIINCSILNTRYNALSLNPGTQHVIISGGNYSYNGYSGVQTFGATFITVVGVKASNNGTSNITINGFDNEVTNCEGSYSRTAHGLNIGHPIAKAQVIRCKISGGSYHDNHMAGIAIYGDSTYNQRLITVEEVNCYNNMQLGIWLNFADSVQFSHCSIYNNQIDGMQILHGSKTIVSDCNVSRNKRYNVYIRNGSKNTTLLNTSYTQQHIDTGTINTLIRNVK